MRGGPAAGDWGNLGRGKVGLLILPVSVRARTAFKT
jgi:hypothetical protein